MARASIRTILTISAAALALAGCVEGIGGSTTGKGDAAPARTQKSTKLVDRDVEAPDVFQVTEDALWDGRPSLGGVWVASADTKDPERVIMRNPSNGKFVIGALFRRERDNPGPKLQISSDAAAALGMLAGAPAKISVTALRREEAPPETPATPILASAETVGGAPAANPAAITAGGVETKPLDAPASAATKPAKGSTKAVAAAPAAVAAPAPAAPAATGGRAIQIGIFSVESNAKRAVDKLAAAGVTGEIRTENAKGKSFWSVIARGNADTVKKIKAAGFADAYLLK